jgi:hypothetical protein
MTGRISGKVLNVSSEALLRYRAAQLRQALVYRQTEHSIGRHGFAFFDPVAPTAARPIQLEISHRMCSGAEK